jgi:hypothetical protein
MAKKACITYDGRIDPETGKEAIHDPISCAKLFEEVLKAEDFEVDLVENMDIYTDPEYMESLALVVPQWTMSEITKEQEKGLIEAVMDGLGMAGWHGGMCDAFRNNVDYQFLTGAQWVAHPGGVIDYEVNIVPEKASDPIVGGLSDFNMHSEQYYMHVDPAVEILATTTFHSFAMPWIDGVKMPCVYKKQWGDGKIFYASFGHVVTDFDVPEAKEIVRRGMLWAARE